MTANDFAPIPSKTAGDLLALCGELRSIPIYRARADALCRELGEALSIAGEHRSHFEMMCAELLEATGRATGRPIPTIATRANVKAALEALEHTAPVLANVVALPRAPERETAKAIEAEAARALADMPGPISVRLWVDHVEREPFDTWAAPHDREVVPCGDERAQVYHVRRVSQNEFEVFALTLCKKGEDTW